MTHANPLRETRGAHVDHAWRQAQLLVPLEEGPLGLTLDRAEVTQPPPNAPSDERVDGAVCATLPGEASQPREGPPGQWLPGDAA